MPKLDHQPLCRYCGAKIRKRTHTVTFGRTGMRSDEFTTSRPELPRSKAEAQRLVGNQQIVSVRWNRAGERDAWSHTVDYDYISQVTTWDGESYEDEFFCNGAHAKDFGYAAARAGHVMPAYSMAKAAQRAERD